MKGRFFGDILDTFQQGLFAVPSDFDAAKEISLRTGHLEDAFGLECRLGSKNFRVGSEANFRTATVWCAAGFLQFSLRLFAFASHSITLLFTRDFDLHASLKRVGDCNADAVQPARG